MHKVGILRIGGGVICGIFFRIFGEKGDFCDNGGVGEFGGEVWILGTQW